MLRTEAAHPTNQTTNEKLGALAGACPMYETCSACGEAFEDGDHVRLYATWSNPSIHHSWSWRAAFCEDCHVYDVDDLPEGTNGAGAANAILAGGVFYDNGRKQKFCPMYLKDERITDEGRYEISNDEGGIPRFREYDASIDGETVAVPANALRAVLRGESLDREGRPGVRQSVEEYVERLLLDAGIDLDAETPLVAGK